MNKKTQLLDIQQDAEQLLKTLYQVLAKLHNLNERQEITDVFLNEVIKLTNATSGAICLHNIDNYQMELVSQYALEEPIKEALSCELIEASYVEFFDFHRHEVLTKKITKLLSQEGLINQDTPQYFHLLPILNASHNLGIVILFSEKKELSSQAAAFLSALVEQLGIALIKIEIFKKTQNKTIVDERNQFARHLHDTVAQSLHSIRLQIQRVKDLLQTDQYEEVQKSIQFIQEAVAESIDTVRQLLTDFRMPVKLTSFSHQLAELIKRFQVLTEINIETSIDTHALDLNQNDRLEMVFILQEALANVHKHAQASLVTLQIYSTATEDRMILKDDGQGFDKAMVLQKSFKHVGIDIMRERAQHLQATLDIESQPDKGTTVTLSVPKQRSE